MNDAGHANQRGKSSVAALVVRLFWMFLGNMVLGVSVLLIVKGGVSLSLIDVLYWLIVPLQVGARYLDVAWFKGNTAYGEPASMDHWRRYTFGLLLFAVCAWLAAHGGTYWLAR